MIELPKLPEGSAIRVRRSGGELKLWWRRLPGWLSGIGDACLATALLAGVSIAYIAVTSFPETPPTSAYLRSPRDWRPMAAMLLLAAVCVFLGYLAVRKFHWPAPETLLARKDSITYLEVSDAMSGLGSVLSPRRRTTIARERLLDVVIGR
ncbi:MAG: hypothetical protein JSV86_08850, partial [Gemmatimonadota bacterium]